MDPSEELLIRKMKALVKAQMDDIAARLKAGKDLLGERGDGMTSMVMFTPEGRAPVQQVELAPEGLEFSEDVSQARSVEESLSHGKWGRLDSMMPQGFSSYARIFHPAYLEWDRERPVRWSTVASWTGRAVHPLMQFERVAGLSEEPGDIYRDPPWGALPQHGSIPERECRALVDVLRGFTSTPDHCFFGLWEGWGNIGGRLYKADSRVRAPHRDHLLFRGALDAVMSFVEERTDPFWGYSPSIWWPEDRAWCVTTDVDLFDTFVGGSEECIEAVVGNPDLEALTTTIEAAISIAADTENVADVPGDGR